MSLIEIEIEIENFLDYLSNFRSSKTVKQKRINLKNLLSFFKRYGLTYKFDNEAIAKYFYFLRNERKLRLSTIKAIFVDTKLFLDYLNDKGIKTFWDKKAEKFIFSSPKLRNEAINEQRKNDEVFTKEELKKVLNYLKERNYIYYLFTGFLAFSGLRLNEGLGVSIKDFERIQPLRWKIKIKGKYSKERIAYLLIPEEFKDLDNYLVKIRKGYFETGKDYLWTYRYKKKDKVFRLNEKSVDKFFREISKELGIKINAHKFRKTFATLLALQNVNPAILKELLGHSDVKTTLKFYTRVEKFLDDNLKIALE